MSCFWCPNWLHISSFRDKAVSHLARLFSMPCKDFPLLRKDVPALLVRRSPHWRAAHTQSRLRPQWEVLQKQEVGDNVWDQRLTWLGESYLWFEMIFWYFLQLLYFWLFLYNVVGTITRKGNCQAPAEDYIFCTSTLGVRKERTSQIFMTKSCWSVGVEPSSCEMNGPEWLTFVASCFRFFATFAKAPLTLQMSRSAVRARRPSPQLSQIRHGDSEVKKCFVAEGAKGTSCPRPFVETTPQRDDASRVFG